MATSNELVDIMSRALGLSRENVAGHMRVLRDDRMLSIKGRGRGAATMTHQDAARLLIAVAASPATKEAVLTTRAFSSLTSPREKGARTAGRPDFEAALMRRFEIVAEEQRNGELHDVYLREAKIPYTPELSAVTFHSALGLEWQRFPKVAVLRWPGATPMTFYPIKYGSSLPVDLSRAVVKSPGLIQARHVSFPAFAEIATAI